MHQRQRRHGKDTRETERHRLERDADWWREVEQGRVDAERYQQERLRLDQADEYDQEPLPW